MKWQKLGLIWAPTGEVDWAQTHATLPVVQTLPDDQWRVYVSCRDAHGKSRIGRLTLDVSELAAGVLPRVLHFDPTPVLSLGEPGTFDDSGVMPSWLVQTDDELRLYYVGWNVLASVPYHVSIGLAVSTDGGATFQRRSQGPTMERSASEPFFVTTPCVIEENGLWRMWYASATGWRQINGKWEPSYHVKYAESSDGLAWRPAGVSCIDAGEDCAVCRPCVFRDDDRYAMLYSYRLLSQYRTDPEQAYRIGYAESVDGVHWRRMDGDAGVERSAAGWDGEMAEYCAVHQQGDQTYLLYNGNGFGQSGVGIARLDLLRPGEQHINERKVRGNAKIY